MPPPCSELCPLLTLRPGSRPSRLAKRVWALWIALLGVPVSDCFHPHRLFPSFSSSFKKNFTSQYLFLTFFPYTEYTSNFYPCTVCRSPPTLALASLEFSWNIETLSPLVADTPKLELASAQLSLRWGEVARLQLLSQPLAPRSSSLSVRVGLRNLEASSQTLPCLALRLPWHFPHRAQ